MNEYGYVTCDLLAAATLAPFPPVETADADTDLPALSGLFTINVALLALFFFVFSLRGGLLGFRAPGRGFMGSFRGVTR